MDKLEKMDFRVARAELVPFLPGGLASRMTEQTWDDMRLVVGERLAAWIDDALGQMPPGGKDKVSDEGMAQVAPQ